MMTAQELLEANGIRLKDYTPGEHSTTCPECSAKRKRENQKKECLSVKIDGAGATWCCHHCRWTGPEKGPTTNGKGGNGAGKTYVYHAADGTPAFRKVRGYDRSGKKFFWMERPDGKGGWIKGTKDVDTKILYRLPEVNKAIAAGSDIACVEGEKDADRLWSIGIPATCNAHGAADPTKNQRSKWKREHSEQLRGGKLVVIPDHDDAGYWHAETTCDLSLGVAKRVRYLELAKHWPDIPKGGDSSDYLDAGHTREEFKALFEKAPEREPPPPPTDEKPKAAGLEDHVALDFAAQHADHFRYVAESSQWMRWADYRWQAEKTLFAFDQSRKLCRDAGDARAKTVSAVTTLARSDRRMAATVDQWDSDVEILNTPTKENP